MQAAVFFSNNAYQLQHHVSGTRVTNELRIPDKLPWQGGPIINRRGKNLKSGLDFGHLERCVVIEHDVRHSIKL